MLQEADPRLTRAARLARQGRYPEATALLTELGGPTSHNPVLLDLLARVHAQQGDLAAADECWTRAIEVGGDLPAARDGRRRIAALRVERSRPVSARVVSVAAVAVLLASTGVVGSALLARQPDRTDPALLADLRESRLAQDNLSKQLSNIQDRVDQVLAPNKATEELRAALADPGWTLRTERDVLTVTFREGLFYGGTSQLSDDGRAALARLAPRLNQTGGDLTITVVGHTDNGTLTPGGRYTDHTKLGLDRALVAAQELSTNSGLPLRSFALTTTGKADQPFPNTTAHGRERNRTVTLRLSQN